MNGKENIINKILSDADVKCQEIIAAAQQQAEAIARDADELINEEKARLTEKIEVLSKEKLSNRLANAELDSRKYVLAQKQRLISACYDKAYKQLVAMSDKDKAAFLTSLLKAHAEHGETVYACKADKNIVTQKFLDGIGKKLVLGKTYLDADGGLILQGEGYDKDLTLSQIIAYVRADTEAAVARALFGE